MSEASSMSFGLSMEKQPLMRRQSLVDDARLESARNREIRVKDVKKCEAINFDLTADEISLLKLTNVEELYSTVSACLIFSIHGELQNELPGILHLIKIHDGYIHKLETRCKIAVGGKDIFVKLTIPRKGLLSIVQSIRQEDQTSVRVVNDDSKQNRCERVWFPKTISDLDKCNHILTKFEPDLDQSHPGFSDPVYRARRSEITQIAFEYKQGENIPWVDYTDEEIKTWGVVFRQLRSLYSKYACSNYRNVFKMLETECGYRTDNIPQLREVSKFLKRKSGFVLRPAAGLVGARDFLASLAFRVFQCTQYVRHSSSPEHSPEPDCIHELLGHAPMLADEEFAKLSQEIGMASLGASDQDIERLATVYWFTVEFGLCREHDKIKAYGAGLLSSFGELQHAVSGKPRLLPFDPVSTALHAYQDQNFQDVYFIAETFQDAKEKIRNYVRKTIQRPFDIIYDPYTETMKVLDSMSKIEDRIKDIAEDTLRLEDAVRRLKKNAPALTCSA